MWAALVGRLIEGLTVQQIVWYVLHIASLKLRFKGRASYQLDPLIYISNRYPQLFSTESTPALRQLE